MGNKIKSTIKNAVKRSPFLATLYRNWRDRRDLSKEPEMTPMGFKFNGNRAMRSGRFEPIESALFKRLIKDVDVVINAGANVGYYCCLALQAGKHVIAFEPMQMNMHYLLRNIAANNWEDDAEVFQLALAEKPGIMKMYGSGTGASLVPGWAGVSKKDFTYAAASSLDLVLGNRFRGKKTFILVDIEGAEYGLLKGAGTLLTSEPKPIWMVEITIQEQQPKSKTINPHFLDVFRLFWNHGYEAYASSERMEPIARDRIEEIAATTVGHFRSSNFVFMRRQAH